MLEVPVYDSNGKQIDTFSVDEQALGGEVNAPLLKQAVVAYHSNRRQGSAANRSRGMIEGSSRKLFRQKGTGNARRGALRTHKVRGGGVAFAKRPHPFRQKMPKGMRKAALNSALLAKILGDNLKIVDGLEMDEPRTGKVAELLGNLEVNRSCVLAIAEQDRNLYLSCRNIPDLTVRVAAELNAFDVATRQKMLVTSEAMKALVQEA